MLEFIACQPQLLSLTLATVTERIQISAGILWISPLSSTENPGGISVFLSTLIPSSSGLCRRQGPLSFS
jgi:Tfp pilus assembly protein PilZ